MSITTFNFITDGFSSNPSHAAGRADAYDDSHTLPLSQLIVRAGMYADYHPDLAYAVGYMDRVIEMRLELDAVSAAETELAWSAGAPVGLR